MKGLRQAVKEDVGGLLDFVKNINKLPEILGALHKIISDNEVRQQISETVFNQLKNEVSILEKAILQFENEGLGSPSRGKSSEHLGYTACRVVGHVIVTFAPLPPIGKVLKGTKLGKYVKVLKVGAFSTKQFNSFLQVYLKLGKQKMSFLIF